MRAATVLLVSFTLLAASACANEQLNSSIEHMNLGIEAFRNGAHGKAVEQFEKAAKGYPENHVAWYYLGQAYREIDRWENSADAFANAVKVKSDNAMYLMFLGIALYHAGKQSMASSYLERAVQTEQGLYRAHWYLGAIYSETERPQEAAQSWSLAATLNPAWGRPFVSLGKLYLRWDMIAEAIAVLEQGKQHAETEQLPDIYYYLGMAYDAQKNWDKAIDAYSIALEKSREMKKDNVEAKFQRGIAYMHKGDKTKARADLEDVSSTSPDPFTKQEANKLLMGLIAEE
jgi:tetratricopeptide (TPR) repeat protein